MLQHHPRSNRCLGDIIDMIRDQMLVVEDHNMLRKRSRVHEILETLARIGEKLQDDPLYTKPLRHGHDIAIVDISLIAYPLDIQVLQMVRTLRWRNSDLDPPDGAATTSTPNTPFEYISLHLGFLSKFVM